MFRYDVIIFLLRCQRQYSFLGFVTRDASCAQLQNCLVTMALFLFNGTSTNTPILGTISVFTLLENPRLTIVHFGKTLRVDTQPAINLGSMLKHQMRV